MEDDGAAGDGINDVAVIGDVAVHELDGSAAGEAGDITGAAYEGADGVAVSEKGGAEPSAEVAGCAGQKYLLHPSSSLTVSVPG